jgi:carbamoyltransferase
MNILGINGLGISPSACLLTNGKLIAFAEEERFNRLKGSFGKMPSKASAYCLLEAGLTLSDIDYIAFGWDAKLYKTFIPLFFARKFISRAQGTSAGNGVFRIAEEMLKYRQGNIEQQLYLMFRSAGMQGAIPPVRYFPHHLCHAASAYYCSGFDDSLVVVIDGSGEYQCTSIFKGNGTDISLLESFEIPDSLGWFYQAVTEYLGFIPNSHEGKVMALAAYGKKDRLLEEKLQQVLSWDENGKYRHEPSFSFTGRHTSGSVYSDALVELLGPARLHKSPIHSYHQDIALAAQNILERAIVTVLSKHIQSEDFNGKLCLAGGVALNCKMNGVIAQLEKVHQVYAPPHCSDVGSALGAALLLAKVHGELKPDVMEHAYWGPDIAAEDLEALLQKMGLRYSKEDSIVGKAATLLAEGKVLAWCQGRMEVGSRALGHRSILANPTQIDTRDFVNARIKSRESWRPFAASILEEYQAEYLQNPQNAPFMTLAFKVTDRFAKLAPAAIHIDGTTRPQLVSKSMDEKYWNLIKAFGDKAGVYAVLNTSFNLNEEPIVCTATDAVRTFFSSSLDFLIIDNFLVFK